MHLRPRCAKRGERSVSSQPRMRAWETVMGKKMLESPMLLWSRKFWTLVLEVVAIDDPAANRDAHAELALLVELAVQRDEGEALAAGETDERGPRRGLERRGLVVAPVEGAERPPQARDGGGGAEARADGALA